MNALKFFKPVKLNRFLPKKKFFSSKTSANVEELSKTEWDVVISGGGMVGCALAASIGSSPLLSEKQVLVLESSSKQEYNVNPDQYSNRVCALNPSTKSLFESFNAWETVCNLRMKEVRKMVVWESCSDARISFQHDDMQDDVAYIVENDVISKALYESLAKLPSIFVAKGVKATDYQLPAGRQEGGVEIQMDGGGTLKTKLLIGADGVNSLVRRKMGVRYLSWNYDQKGIVATLKLAEPTENVVAWQRFLPTGPIALLPLTDELCSLVWTVSNPMCERLLKMTDEQFVDALNAALWTEDNKNSIVESALQNLRNVMSALSPGSVRQLPPSILSVGEGSRAAFPLGFGHATEYVAPGVALIGDAAHRVHPLAGQGVNLGFGDVNCLTGCLEKAVYDGRSIAEMDSLLDYETQRQRHNVPTMFAIDALNRLYKTQATPLVLARSLGLAAIDLLAPVKARIMKQAAS